MRIITADGEHIIERVVSMEDYHAKPEPTPAVTFHYVDCARHPANIHRIQAVIEECGSVRLVTWNKKEVVGVRYLAKNSSSVHYRDDIILKDGSSFVDTWFLPQWYQEKGRHSSLVERAVYGFYEPDIKGADGVFG